LPHRATTCGGELANEGVASLDRELLLHIFEPLGHKPTVKRACLGGVLLETLDH
jgi:hypothetical protein